MWIMLRSMDGETSKRLYGVSKLTKIETLREMISKPFGASADLLRLFYRGKQMEDEHTLFDYNVNLNDVIQVLVRPAIAEEEYRSNVKISDESCDKLNSEASDESAASTKENEGYNQTTALPSSHQQSKFYKVGDRIDARDLTNGTWLEAKIIAIAEVSENEVLKEQSTNRAARPDGSLGFSHDCEQQTPLDDNMVYHVKYEGWEEDEPTLLRMAHIRPRAWHLLKFDDVKVGDFVMVNYNVDNPHLRGYWYDAVITQKAETRTVKQLAATVFIGVDQTPLENCKLMFPHEVFRVERHVELSRRASTSNYWMQIASPIKRQSAFECNHCQDNPTSQCRHCACCVCGYKEDPDKQLLCDECNLAYHLGCLSPPLSQIPEEEEWYCPGCKNDVTEVVHAGEKLKHSNKKSKMKSATSTTSRDWGKGMACMGRTKECTIVPRNHFGPIPGVEVGTMWRFRMQASEAGIHRPHVAGIHGREVEGAYSIVLAGGYEDDVDRGEEFTYTGSGGRDLSGNRRTAEQSCDQTLTRMNRALALNCDAPLDNKNGAVAKVWQKGKPVRVIRSAKGRKDSKYCPEEGIRYDGIYKVVKYWPEKGKSGFLVWRYLLMRDDLAHAPWTKDGKCRIMELGLKMQYPEGYLEALENKETSENALLKVSKRKRIKKDIVSSPPCKQPKATTYQLPGYLCSLIKQDVCNQRLWEDCLKVIADGQQIFLGKVEEMFMCICCQEVVFKPVTTKCQHNICQPCLARSVKANVYTCPVCRTPFDKDMSTTVNETLAKVLRELYPGYETSRL